MLNTFVNKYWIHKLSVHFGKQLCPLILPHSLFPNNEHCIMTRKHWRHIAVSNMVLETRNILGKFLKYVHWHSQITDVLKTDRWLYSREKQHWILLSIAKNILYLIYHLCVNKMKPPNDCPESLAYDTCIHIQLWCLQTIRSSPLGIDSFHLQFISNLFKIFLLFKDDKQFPEWQLVCESR